MTNTVFNLDSFKENAYFMNENNYLKKNNKIFNYKIRETKT